jgi:hypothetical protein
VKNVFKNSIVVLWIVAVLVASTGFSLHTTYCFCMNQYETSLFQTTHACKKTHEDDADTAHLHPCCKKALALKKAKECSEKQGGCTKTTIKLVKADLKFLELKKTALPKIAFESVLTPTLSIVFFEKTLSNYASIPRIADRAPPQLYGRQLLNFIQVYRI